MIQSPVRLETQGSVGADRGVEATTSANSSRIGSIIAEWKACEVASRRAATSRSAKRASKRSIAAVSPETTVRLGAFSAAISRSSGRSSRTSSPVARTASIVPSGRACMSRARSATSRSASSRVNTPPRHAATYSPTEWPIMLSGSTPSRRHAIARAYSMTNRAGWVTAVCPSRCSASSSPPGSG